MKDDEKNVVSRRGALRSLLGLNMRDRVRATGLVEDYRAVLRAVVGELAFGVRADRLPAPASELADAIVEVATKNLLDLPRVTLRDAYASLALFRDAEEIELLHRGKAALDRQDFSEEAQEGIRVAFARRNELLLERARLEREFEERVPRPAPPTPPAASSDDETA